MGEQIDGGKSDGWSKKFKVIEDKTDGRKSDGRGKIDGWRIRSITFSSIHQIFLHQFAHPSTFPPSTEENNKKSSIILASLRISAIK